MSDRRLKSRGQLLGGVLRLLANVIANCRSPSPITVFSFSLLLAPPVVCCFVCVWVAILFSFVFHLGFFFFFFFFFISRGSLALSRSLSQHDNNHHHHCHDDCWLTAATAAEAATTAAKAAEAAKEERHPISRSMGQFWFCVCGCLWVSVFLPLLPTHTHSHPCADGLMVASHRSLRQPRSWSQ